MARRYAQIQVSIWSDFDFKALPAVEQHMYFVLLSQPRLNLCGVLDFLPSRIALCVDEWTTDDVETLVKGLEERRYVVIDRDSHELLLRTFVRNDSLLTNKNVSKGMAAEYGEIISDSIRAAIDVELRKAFREDSTLAGWPGLKESNPVLFRNITEGLS